MTSISPQVRISMTQFLNFANAKNTGARITAVRNAKAQSSKPYSPGADPYKKLREKIVSLNGAQISAADRSALIGTLRIECAGAIDGYNKYVKKGKYTKRQVKRKLWTHGRLEILVSPEIALEDSGVTTYYKLYFNKDKYTKKNAESVYQLMYDMISPVAGEDIALFDLRASRCVPQPSLLPDPVLLAALHGDAMAYVSIWDAV